MIESLPRNMQTKIRPEECFIAGLDPTCWIWTGAVQGKGYGSVGHQKRIWSSHKLAYTLLVGPVPEGLTLDHLCRNKLCCNPAHLEAVTNLENIRRGLSARGYRRDAEPSRRLTDDELAEAMRPFAEFFGDSWRTA